MKDFPNHPPYSAETFAAWLREHYPVADPRRWGEEEAEEMEEKGYYCAFEISFPILAKREFNKPLKLGDGTTTGVSGGVDRVLVVHSADYGKCVNDFAALLELLGRQGHLSALDIRIHLLQGIDARWKAQWWKWKTNDWKWKTNG
jgi:hypothetical protein